MLPRLATVGVKARVLALDYGLAPQHGHAAALAHCGHAWQSLVNQLRAEDDEDGGQEGAPEGATPGGAPADERAALAAAGAGRRDPRSTGRVGRARVGFGRGTRVVLCGDSAGGHLVVALTQRLRNDAAAEAEAAAGEATTAPVRLPAALAVLSP